MKFGCYLFHRCSEISINKDEILIRMRDSQVLVPPDLSSHGLVDVRKNCMHFSYHPFHSIDDKLLQMRSNLDE